MTFPPPHHPAAPVNPCPERKSLSRSCVGLPPCTSQFAVSDPDPMYGARPAPGPMGLQYQCRTDPRQRYQSNSRAYLSMELESTRWRSPKRNQANATLARLEDTDPCPARADRQ